MNKTLTLTLNNGARVFADADTWDTYTYNKEWFVIMKGSEVVSVYSTCDIFSVSVESYEVINYDNKPQRN